MDERRQIPRWTIDREADIMIAGHPGAVRGRVRDINGKGLQLSVPAAFPAEQPLHLRLIIDKVLDLEIEAESPWQARSAGEHRYGLRFTRIHDLDKERIYEYVRTTFPDQIRRQWWAQG